jgi:hypothetical protein
MIFVLPYVLAGFGPRSPVFEAYAMPGANPTIASYNASVVNFYNATDNLARFENKNILFYFENAVAYYIQRWRCSCKFKSRRIGSRTKQLL